MERFDSRSRPNPKAEMTISSLDGSNEKPRVGSNRTHGETHHSHTLPYAVSFLYWYSRYSDMMGGSFIVVFPSKDVCETGDVCGRMWSSTCKQRS